MKTENAMEIIGQLEKQALINALSAPNNGGRLENIVKAIGLAKNALRARQE